ncbi:MAG TPA: transposase [Cyclobacteriaceae bacterium]|nr:transposase [Cyclobacteriaceae bacterium]HOO08760.1 transposase [Cyclobacteriaceae bacterium]
MDPLANRRKSHIEPGGIYFWTATINKWQQLLLQDDFKDIIIDSLSHLSKKGKIDVFAFVIMPNHIHLIWRVNENNGKESSSASFLKHTAHAFKKKLKRGQPNELMNYAVKATNKQFEFWQRDSLAVRLFSGDIAFQKLDYIHANPVSGRWQLVKDYCDYKYSTAKYYELGIKEFDLFRI